MKRNSSKRSSKTVFRQLGVLAQLLLFAGIVNWTACNGGVSRSVEATKTEIVEVSIRSRAEYLNADLASARKLTKELIDRLLLAVDTEIETRAFYLSMAYGQLSYLETLANDNDAAEIAFIGYKYWSLLRLKAFGKSDAEALLELNRFTKEYLFSIIREQDLASTGGKGPKFMENLQGTNANTGVSGAR